MDSSEPAQVARWRSWVSEATIRDDIRRRRETARIGAR